MPYLGCQVNYPGRKQLISLRVTPGLNTFRVHCEFHGMYPVGNCFIGGQSEERCL